MMSLFSTKNGSVPSRIFLARASGPAVPRGSVSWEMLILIPNWI